MHLAETTRCTLFPGWFRDRIVHSGLSSSAKRVAADHVGKALRATNGKCKFVLNGERARTPKRERRRIRLEVGARVHDHQHVARRKLRKAHAVKRHVPRLTNGAYQAIETLVRILPAFASRLKPARAHSAPRREQTHQKLRRRLRIWSNSNRYGSATCLFAARITMSWEKTEALYQLKLPSRTK
jgi:hypothetical protein